MDTVDHALRLLQTQSAAVATMLAVVAVAVAVLIVGRLAAQGRFRLAPAVLVISAGLVVATGVVNASYAAWYRHRCVEHHSDIPECDSRG